jgi:LAO/AO transport system kinase
MLKAGILEIGDVFVVNKADLDGADRTVQQLREMLQNRGQGGRGGRAGSGHHGPDQSVETAGESTEDGLATNGERAPETWAPPIVETVANRGEGVETFLDALADHGDFLDRTGRRDEQERARFAAEIRTLLREDANGLVTRELDRQGGLDRLVDDVVARETDPYTVVDEVLAPLRECLDRET